MSSTKALLKHLNAKALRLVAEDIREEASTTEERITAGYVQLASNLVAVK